MKQFNLKVMAFVAAFGAASSAFGGITDDVVLSVYDPNIAYSYTFDTGVSVNTFNATPDYSFDLVLDPNYESFLAAVDSKDPKDTLLWNVAAANGAPYILSTGYSPDFDTNSKIGKSYQIFDAYVNAASALPTYSATPLIALGSGSGYDLDYGGENDEANAANATWSNHWGEFLPVITDDSATVGSGLDFLDLACRNANCAATGYGTATQLGVWNLSSAGVLTYADPVPEPASWMMLIAGVLGIAILTRRRLSSLEPEA